MSTDAFNRGLDMVTEVEASAGGEALREQMVGRATRPWMKVPPGERKKWIHTASVVIAAAKSAAEKASR